jgi:hypothetical protein
VQDPEAPNAIFQLAFGKRAELRLVGGRRRDAPVRRAAVDRRLPPRGDGTTQRACRGLTHGPNARSSVSLVDALLPGGILATSGLTRNTRTRLALGHVSREATNFCLTFALLVLI